MSDIPEWVNEKYHSSENPVEAQAQAYNDINELQGKTATELGELRTKFTEMETGHAELKGKYESSFGAPESYALPEIEGFQFEGGDDPLLASFGEFAKTENLSQDLYGKLMGQYALVRAAEIKADNDSYEKELGDLPDGLKQNIEDWAKASIPEELRAGFDELAITANGVKALAHIAEKAGMKPLDVPQGTTTSAPTDEEIREMQFAKDEHGQPKMRDPEYASRVRGLMKAKYGDGDHKTIVG